jgi:hypothetical protein
MALHLSCFILKQQSQHTGASGELTEGSVRALLHQFTTAKYSAESLADWTHQPHSSGSSSSSSSKTAKQQQLQQSSNGTAASATDSNGISTPVSSTADSMSVAAVHNSGNSTDTDDNSSDSSSINEYDSFATLLPDDIQPGSIVKTMHFPGENNVSMRNITNSYYTLNDMLSKCCITF